MPGTLNITAGPNKGQYITLGRDGIDIGRDSTCFLALDDRKVSRRHARIQPKGAGYEVVDQESSNGTKVNGREIERHLLKDADLIRIGETWIEFRLTEEHAPSGRRDKRTVAMNAAGVLDTWARAEDPDGLQRAKVHLEALYNAGQAFNATLDLQELMPRIVNIVFNAVPRIGCCSIHLLDEETDALVCIASQSRSEKAARSEGHPFSRSLLDQVLEEKQAVLTRDAASDERFDARRSIQEHNIHSAICVPLEVQGSILGVLQTSSTDPRDPLTEEDLHLLAALGLQAGAALQNARLYENLRKEKEALKHLQDQLVQSEKMAAVGQLSGGVVHDVKAPMTVILNYSGMLRLDLEEMLGDGFDRSPMKEFLDRIDQGVRHSNEVVNNLLEFARPSDPAREPMDMNDLVGKTLDFLKTEIRKKSIRLTVSPAEDLPVLSVDPRQIQQVLINLIMNALEAMASGGRLEVETGKADDEHGSYVTTRVSDTGKGMTEEQRKKVFDPFFTTKADDPNAGTGGTGLGLSVSYSIAKNHGGHLAVESVPGEGSAFTLSLPAE